MFIENSGFHCENILRTVVLRILYDRKYWQSLNLAVWFQTEREKVVTEFKFGGGASQRIMSS